MNDEPQNKHGQKPSSTPKETLDRLEQKKQEDVGKANRDRIDEKAREITR
jgi:hypothetical protein